MTRRPLAICLILLAFSASSPAGVVEEVLATVDTSPILRSDLALAELVEFGGLAPARGTGTYGDLLSARVRLELQYLDLEGTGGLERLVPDVDTALLELVDGAGGRDALAARLDDHGLTWEDVEALALRVATTRAWVDQQLRPRVVVTSTDLRRLYDEVFGQNPAGAGPDPPPFLQVQGQLRQLAEERGLNAEIRRWMTQARERHEVTRFVQEPQPPAP